MVSGHHVPRRVGGWRSWVASDGESEFYHSGAEPRWGFSTIKRSAEEALCVPLIAKLKAKINTRKSFWFWSLTEKESAGPGAGAKSRVSYAPNLEDTDCGMWRGCARLPQAFCIFSFSPLVLSKIKGGKQRPSVRCSFLPSYATL